MSRGHIRPKIRNAAKPNQQQSAASSPAPQEQALEDVRLKMENWMGIGENANAEPRKPNASETMFLSSISIPSTVVESKNTSVANNSSDNRHETPSEAPKSILKKPKYSQPVEAHMMHSEPEPQHKNSIFKQDCIRERLPSSQKSTKQPIQWKNMNPEEAASAAMAVEGYQPRRDHNVRIKTDNDGGKEEGDDEPPIIFNSLADMMQMAGNLPEQNLEKDPKIVEAELAFSCMTQDDYNAGLILQGMEQQQQTEKEKFGSNSASENLEVRKTPVVCNAKEFLGDEGREMEDDDLFCFIGDDDDDVSEGEEPVVTPPRTFRILWECLSPLITHESCVFLRRLKQEQEKGSSYLITTTPLSDLENSRANGFLSMLRLYMARALKELDQPVEMRRTAEQRLQGLLFTFNFSRPAAKLETKHWKALTCILLETVLFLNQHVNDKDGEAPPLPPSASVADMKPDEYYYLVNNTIKTFDIPDAVI